MSNVLIVDDDADLRNIVADVLKGEDIIVDEASDGFGAIKLFRKTRPDAVLLDLKMPHMNGIETMIELMKIERNVPIIILTAHGDIDSAVKAIKHGAYDFTLKPPDFDRLILTIKRAIEKRKLQMEVENTGTALKQLLGKSDAMNTVISQIKQIAHTDFSVIIQGETGTGKSITAGLIHNMSKREDESFVCVDIGLIPDILVESELFGYKKGAFTGAVKDKMGYFESAHKGTIFIDELENMSPHIQTKLLSVIEKKKIYPLGGTSPIDVDLRIVAATNQNIRESLKKKEFREDLFYRLGEFIITLPPLRERLGDIPFFARKFVFEVSLELNKQIRDITDNAIDLLKQYPWPGNLRELKNVMRRATLLTNSSTINKEFIEILLNEHYTEKKCMAKSASGQLPLKDALRELEKKMIRDAMENTGGNKAKAAKLLRISYKNLFDKMKEYENQSEL